MIALEVNLNGKCVCIAGAEDLVVLATNISAVGKLGEKTAPARPDEAIDIHYSVVGLTGRKDPETDLHLRWKSVAPLSVGDVIQVRIFETNKADPARSRQKANRRSGEPSGSRQRRVRAADSRRKSQPRRA